MIQPLKIALIGAGGWGFQHARVLSERLDVDFCAIVGRSEERTKARAEQFRTRYYLNVAEMLEREKPDLVSICLPNQEHYASTLEVIQAGYPLLVEKPLAFELAEADTLLQEAARRKLFFAINFNHRYARPVQMAKSAIEKGRLGQIVFATWRFGGEGQSGHPFANLIETQCHGFDMLEYLCGPIKSVMAQMTDITDNGYSTMVLALHFVSGAVGSLVGSYDSSYAYPGTHLLEINGTQGRLVIEDTVRKYTFHSTGSELGETWEAGYFNDRERDFHRTFDAHMSHLINAFRNGDEPPIHAQAGARALRLAYAAIESFQTGRRITIEAPDS